MGLIIIIVFIVLLIFVVPKATHSGKCIKCGKKVNGLESITLNDGTMICNDCFSQVPKCYKEYALKNWSTKDFDDFNEYIDYSNNKLLPRFEATASYGDLYVDENNGTFFVSHGLISSKPVANQPIFEFKNLQSVDFRFEPEELKEGIFRTSVKGNVYFIYTLLNINIGESIEIMYGESAKAEKNFFGTKITYGLPERLKDFEMKFIATYIKFKPSDNLQSQVKDEVSDALNLFMFDSLDEVTHEKLKEQRNRLIKAFHPDENGNIDSKYAAKINDAFKILDEKCPG